MTPRWRSHDFGSPWRGWLEAANDTAVDLFRRHLQGDKFLRCLLLSVDETYQHLGTMSGTFNLKLTFSNRWMFFGIEQKVFRINAPLVMDDTIQLHCRGIHLKLLFKALNTNLLHFVTKNSKPFHKICLLQMIITSYLLFSFWLFSTDNELNKFLSFLFL